MVAVLVTFLRMHGRPGVQTKTWTLTKNPAQVFLFSIAVMNYVQTINEQETYQIAWKKLTRYAKDIDNPRRPWQ